LRLYVKHLGCLLAGSTIQQPSERPLILSLDGEMQMQENSHAEHDPDVVGVPINLCTNDIAGVASRSSASQVLPCGHHLACE